MARNLILLFSNLFLIITNCFAQFDTGIDQHWLKSQPNPYGRTKYNNGPYPASSPNKADFFYGVDGGIFVDSFVWNSNYSTGTISGQVYSPIQKELGIDILEEEGLDGTGFKIGFIDDGFCGTYNHISLPNVVSASEPFLPGGVDTNNYLHTMEVMSVACAYGDSAKILGMASGASIYSRRGFTGNVYNDLLSLDTQGVDVVIITTQDTASFDRDKLYSHGRDMKRRGKLIIVAGGNSSFIDTVNILCAIPGSICIGSRIGGANLTFKDSLYHFSIIPRAGKGLDYVFPHLNLIASYNPDCKSCSYELHKLSAGSSYTAPLLSYIVRLKKKHPNMTLPEIEYNIKRWSIGFIDRGQTFFKPTSISNH